MSPLYFAVGASFAFGKSRYTMSLGDIKSSIASALQKSIVPINF